VWLGVGFAARVNFSYNALGQEAEVDRYSDAAGTQLVVSESEQYNSRGELTNQVCHARNLGTFSG
jgi:hypothetical protein